MSKLQWYVNRLRAMNINEIVWRLDQKRIQREEKQRFGAKKISVASDVWNPRFRGLAFDCNALGINFGNKSYGTNTDIHLLKGADYDRWPDEFSYSLDYKQRDDLGDARTNWEKNRHFQWALMAKAIFVESLDESVQRRDESVQRRDERGEKREECVQTREERRERRDERLEELCNEIEEWMDKNPFLWGISWTSAMEFAIRSINWMYTLAFLSHLSSDTSRLSSENLSSIVSRLSSDTSRLSSENLSSDNLSSTISRLTNGIINITEYLTKHYSRYSSANNHLLVEATAIGLAGCAFNNEEWINLACRILSEELENQNYEDGVNKELSLHYQTFGMEAYLLLANAILRKETRGKRRETRGKRREIVESWMPMLKKEAEFVAYSSWREKTVCEFGDDDEGKIIDLRGESREERIENREERRERRDERGETREEEHQWEWVLQLASLVTGTRYSSFEHVCENTHWMFTAEEIEAIKAKPYFANHLSSNASRLSSNHLSSNASRLSSNHLSSNASRLSSENLSSLDSRLLSSRCFDKGGNSFLRDKDDRVLIGIDHAELGFGSIAAHGHADALSFQILVDGQAVITDPGTYIYHCDLPMRNAFRKTINHSTLCLIDDQGTFVDQSQMLGAFLWGKRAVTKLESVEIGDSVDRLIASHDGYKPNVHQRTFVWDKIGKSLLVKDNLKFPSSWVVTFMIGPEVDVDVNDVCATLTFCSGKLTMDFAGCNSVKIEDAEVSMEYGVKVSSKAVRVYGSGNNLTTKMQLFID